MNVGIVQPSLRSIEEIDMIQSEIDGDEGRDALGLLHHQRPRSFFSKLANLAGFADRSVRAYRDGMWWRSRSDSQRLMYAVGYADAHAVLKKAAAKSFPALNVEENGKTPSPRELFEGLDEFYILRENRKVSVVSALYYVSRGYSEPEVDRAELLRRLRS